MNRALEFAEQTRRLYTLCADLITPKFIEALTPTLESCDSFGLAFCVDERIDENNQHLSASGHVTGEAKEISVADYLLRKAEIANQALGGTPFKTNLQKVTRHFHMDMLILADLVS